MEFTRRDFLKTAVASGATVAAGLQAGCGNPVDVPPSANATVLPGGDITVALASHKSLAVVGGALTLNLRPLPGAALPDSAPTGGILLVHRGAPGDAPEWIAVDSQCTHLQCPVGYSTQDQTIECPCHASRFLAKAEGPLGIGTPTHLPATIALRSYMVSYDSAANSVTIALGTQCSPPPADPMRPPVIVAAAKNNLLTLSLDAPEMAALKTVGGFVTAVAPAGSCDRLLLMRIDAATVTALSSVCTHQRCDVDYDSTAMQVNCHCHLSLFDLKGNVLTGPAPAPLKVYDAKLSANTVVVTLA